MTTMNAISTSPEAVGEHEAESIAPEIVAMETRNMAARCLELMRLLGNTSYSDGIMADLATARLRLEMAAICALDIAKHERRFGK